MKVFREIILVFLAIVVLCLSLSIILGTVEIINLNKIFDVCFSYIISNGLTVIIICAVISIFALIGIFTKVEDKNEIKSGIAIKRETGNVYIAKETFESIVQNVAKSFMSLKNFKVLVSIAEDGITASIFTYILPDTVVPTLTAKLQEDIKDAILKQTTVELKEVNIKIKGVYAQAEKTTAQN